MTFLGLFTSPSNIRGGESTMFKKKTYMKPQINKVKLATEEAVLQACKLTGTGSAGSKNDGSCKNLQFSCQAPGS
jgi:hypothetical protein